MSTVLLVEDELLVRELAFEDLTDAGLQVTAANDGDEALAILREGRQFDLLFTDIRMPGMTDGWELARIAKEMLPGLKVIYATGMGETDYEFPITEAYVRKPYTISDLRKALDNLGFQLATVN